MQSGVPYQNQLRALRALPLCEIRTEYEKRHSIFKVQITHGEIELFTEIKDSNL